MNTENFKMNDSPQSTIRHPQSAGFSLLELIITLSILSILVASVVPLTRNNLKRQREYELKQTLREVRPIGLRGARAESQARVFDACRSLPRETPD